MKPLRVLVLSLAALLAACVTAENKPAEPAKPVMHFIDIQRFDTDLSNSLSAPLPKVEVAFHDAVKPSALPPRLQTWMAAVEKGGGTVTVTPPPATVQSKGAFMLLGAITSLWSAGKMAKEVSADERLASAHAYNAEMILKETARGDVIIDRIVFVQRAR